MQGYARQMENNIVVIGIGQSLRGDDSVGLAAVKIWQSKYMYTARQTRVEFAEVPGLNLLNLMIGSQYALLIDAVKSCKYPGYIHRIEEEQIAAFNPGTQSAHGWGIAETITMGRKLYPHSMPKLIRILGIEIASIDMGVDLSPIIEASLPHLVLAVQEQVQMLLTIDAPVTN